MKKILITAGATMVMIDATRGITNVFKGTTGTKLAEYFFRIGYGVTLITSNPDLAYKMKPRHWSNAWRIMSYRTYDELYGLMEQEICQAKYDVVIHSAAVSDYKVDEVCTIDDARQLAPIDRTGKISSDHAKLCFIASQTVKIIDQIRDPWGFNGYLVKFKFQTGFTDDQLKEIAANSRIHSQADMIVANCGEWMRERAIVMTADQIFDCHRLDMPVVMAQQIERALS